MCGVECTGGAGTESLLEVPGSQNYPYEAEVLLLASVAQKWQSVPLDQKRPHRQECRLPQR